MEPALDEALRLERALDVVNDVFVLFDSEFRVVYHNEANRAAMRASGMDPDYAIGRHVLEAMPQIAGTIGHRESERALRDRVPTEWEETYNPDLRLRGRAYPTADGGLIVVASNVTAEWQAREAARAATLQEQAARAAAEQANRAKSDFLAAMSHELRTPLNAIGGYAEILTMGLRGPLTREQEDDLRRISHNQAHLLGIINDILNFARLEAGHIEIEREVVPVHEVLASVRPLMAPQLAEKRIVLTVRPHDPAIAVLADRERVEQVVTNLVANATKFTNAGGAITIDVSAPTDDAVHIVVSDTGIGIPRDRLSAIFEPFVQAHRSLTQPTTGTGLGLAISRDLARRMGGDIDVESELGVGSAFTLVLPRGGLTD